MYRRMNCWTLVRELRLLFPISLEEGSVYKVTASRFTLLEVNPYNIFFKLEVRKKEEVNKKTE